MNFDYPWLLFLLPGVYFVFKKGYKSSAVRFAPLGWQTNQISKKFLKESWVSKIEMFMYVLIVIALSGPNINLPRDSVNMDGIDLVITLDLSASMQAADFSPNRLEAMKVLVKEYLQESRGNRTAIVVFSGKVFLHYPFTNNKYALQTAIDSIHFQTIDHNKAGGTNIGDALLFSTAELEKVKVDKREQAILVLTDGENTGGVDPLISAKAALKSGIHLYIIGLAGEEPVPVFESDGDPFIGANGKQVITSLNDSSLKEIAKEGGGVYYRAKEGDSLKTVLHEIGELEKHPLEIKKVTEKVSLSLPIAILASITFFGFYFGTGIWLRRPLR
jgi:Ca-activated chloride channel family protein